VKISNLYNIFVVILLLSANCLISQPTNSESSYSKTKDSDVDALADTTKIKHFNEVVIYGASKKLEKITESPTAISTLNTDEIGIASRTNQVGSAFEGFAGIDILRNGTTDYIVNSRGFNNGLNRRLLVLQDGRDLAMPLLGAQEWNSLSLPLEEFSKIEFIKGPASSLYGANSFNGVMALTSYAPKEVLGTKISLTAGDYQTYRGDIRHAGLITDDLSYKITFGRSGSLNLSKSRTDSSMLEYEGVKLERRPIYDNERNTSSVYGTVRLDYEVAESNKVTLELGYSDSGNEVFVQPLGRVLVTNTQRPYTRLAYNSEHFNFQASYMTREVRDSMWLLFAARGPGYPLGSPILTDDNDIMLDFQYNENLNESKTLALVLGVSQQFQYINTGGTTLKDAVNADFTGVYAQLSYDLSKSIKVVTSGRMDRTNLHNTQFSPRAALVIDLNDYHKLRLSASSSFQRPNYSELYRYTPDRGLNAASNANLSKIDAIVTDSLRSWTNNSELDTVKLGLNSIRGLAVGNNKLDVEKNLGFEIGYQAVINDDFFFTADIYYNQLTNFVTNFGPGYNANINKWQSNLGGNLSEFDQRVTNLVYNRLIGDDKTRLAEFNGNPTLIQSVGNFGNVEQYGIDLSLNWYASENLIVSGNFSQYNFILNSKPGDPEISANTAPNKANIAVQYLQKSQFDIKMTIQYCDTYKWISGASVGQVPAYTIANLSAGYYISKNFELSTYIFNVLDSKVIQIFGGTYLPRQFNLKATLNIN
jgi:outer membrane receptor protein involved in Fe transport